MEASEAGGRTVAHFYLRPVLDEAVTAEAGMPRHKDAEYLRISLPGDRSMEVDRPVRGPDRERFPREYAAFIANRQGQEEFIGTPLSLWPQLGASTVEDYRFHKVRTVEQLAGLSDSLVSKLGRGTLKHRQMARDFIESAKSAAPMLRVQSELQSRDEQIAALQNALKEQGDRLEALAAGRDIPVHAVREVSVEAPEAAPVQAPKKRGRPPKTQKEV